MNEQLSKEQAKVAQAIIAYLEHTKVQPDFMYSMKWIADGIANRIGSSKYRGTKERFGDAQLRYIGLETQLERDKDSVPDELGKQITDDYARLEAQFNAELGLENIMRSVQDHLTYTKTGAVVKVA